MELPAEESYVIETLISDIEKHKARIRIEYDDLKNAYLAGRYRSEHGLTKRQCEDRLATRNGEVLGMEYALSYLYKQISDG